MDYCKSRNKFEKALLSHYQNLIYFYIKDKEISNAHAQNPQKDSDTEYDMDYESLARFLEVEIALIEAIAKHNGFKWNFEKEKKELKELIINNN